MPRPPQSASAALLKGLASVTKEWTKQKKREERHANAHIYRASAWDRVTVRDAVWKHLEAAYLKASANNTLPTTARQIYYAIREVVRQHNSASKELAYDYFAQTLLPEYVEEHDAEWDVVYDDRGHLHEPHGDRGALGLGTLSVRSYLSTATGPTLDESIGLKPAAVELHGPEYHYGAILFVEKEGFMPLFQRVRLAERYDLAIMSTKGMSNTASRRLVDTLCAEHEIPLLVLHDFDVSGFSIVGTLRRDTRRYAFEHAIEVVDLGLRLADIKGLARERYAPRGRPWSLTHTLAENGASPQEIEILLRERVELNELASDVLVDWIEKKLKAHGVEKVVPDKHWLGRVFRHAVAVNRVSEDIEDLIEAADKKVRVPRDLADRVVRHLKKHRAQSWPEAVIAIAGNGRQAVSRGARGEADP